MARILALVFINLIFGLPCISSQTPDADRLGTARIFSSKKSIGKPLVQNYSPEEYGASPQCKQIRQSSNGLIYVINGTNSLVEFDGASWQNISLPDSLSQVSMAINGQGKIYLGGAKDIGYLSPNPVGRLQFHSLLPELDPEDRKEFSVHTLIVEGDQVYFVNWDRIFRWDGRQMQTWKAESRFLGGQVSGGIYYGYQEGIGLFSIKEDSIVLFPPGIRMTDRLVRWIIPFSDEQGHFDDYPPMILACDDGLYLLKDQQLNYIEGPASRYSIGEVIRSAVVLGDNLFGICTSKGAIVFDASGNIIQELNKSSGIPNDVVYDILPDQEGGLWLATLQGISRINSSRPALTRFDKSMGLGVVSFEFVSHQGNYYLRSTAGIHILDPLSGQVELVEGLSGLDWSLFKLEGELYAARTSLHRIEGKRSFRVKKLSNRTFLAQESAFIPNGVFMSFYGKSRAGISLLKKEGNRWLEMPLVDEMPAISFMMVEAPGGILWATQFDGGTAVRLRLSRQGSLLQEDRYSTVHGLPNGNIEVVASSKGLFFYGASGLLDFDDKNQRFIPSRQVDFPGAEKFAVPAFWTESLNGNFWFINSGENGAFPSVFRRKPTGDYELDDLPFRRLNMSGLYLVATEADSIIWFGGEDGLFRYDDTNRKTYSVGFDAMVRRVKIIRGGAGRDSLVLMNRKTLHESLILPFQDNSLRFEFAAASMEMPSATQYRFFLEGFDPDWSAWTDETQKDYTNLPEGGYTFRVMAKNCYDHLSQEGKIKVKILPPWHRTFWAYLLYAIAGLGSLFLIVYGYNKIRTRQLELQNQELEQTVLEKTNELRQSNEKLIVLDQLKSRFFTDISHELRTPLTVISGMSEQILEDPNKWSHKGSLLIQRNSNGLLDLVTQILDLRKLEVGKLELKLVQGNIVAYLSYLVESFVSLAESKEIKILFKAEQEELIMDYDSEKLLRIVSNLLSNAIKFTPAGGTVSIHASMKKNASQDQFYLQVKDTGVGVSPQKLPYIFDRFYQVNANDDLSLGSESGGFGIGLALTRELVKLMDGDIAVESRLGEGTSFTISLPVRRTAEMFTEMGRSEVLMEHYAVFGAVASTDPLVSSGSQQITDLPSLLIVEDNPDVMQYLVACLEDKFQLRLAKDGQEGIDKAFDQSPDIILSDVMMPRKNGFELCQTLKLDRRTSHIPIVLLTAKADVESRIIGLERGADAYLAKPFNKQELLVSLQKLVEIRRRLQQRYSIQEDLLPSNDPVLQAEDVFIKKIRELVEQNIDDENFGPDELARAMNMARSSFFAKIRALTSRTPALHIRSIRLHHSKKLLKNKELNISQVAYEVGFNDPNYFSRCFSQEFGISPKQFRG